ncbi:MAG: hypothetical protein LBG84_10795 [Treponema sp.]|jgi:hypothetical protein|nr:hypothetical protein [Treponema sp.]
MDISINGKTADITLEAEKTLGEVLAGVDNWLAGSGLFLSGLEVDGKTYGAHSMEEAFSLSLETIGTVDLKTSGWAELTLEALEELRDELEEPGGTAAEDRVQAWKESPAALFLGHNAPELYDTAVKTLEGSFPPGGTLSLIAERIREIKNPFRELADSQGMIRETARRLEDLPLDTQTGKDVRAAETITLFSALTEKIYRLIFLFKHYGIGLETVELSPETINLKDYIEEFSAALKELYSAYESKDTVLVGDLAEYELAPRLLRIGSALGDLAPAGEI